MRLRLALLLGGLALCSSVHGQLRSFSRSDFGDNCSADFDEQMAESGPSLTCTTAQTAVTTASSSTVARFGYLEATSANSINYECEESGGSFAWSEFDDLVVVHDPAGGSGTFEVELTIDTLLDASGLDTQFGGESASYRIEVEIGSYSEVFTDCTATRLPCGPQNPAPATLVTPPILYMCGTPLRFRVRVEVSAGGGYTVTETVGTSLAFARVTWAGMTGLSQDASGTSFRDWIQPASTTQCTFGRLSIVDPHEALRDGPLVTDEVGRLAVDGAYVGRVAADGVTPVIVRFETDVPGVVDLSVEDETGSHDVLRVGTLVRTVGSGSGNPLAVDMLPLAGRFYGFATLTAPVDFARGPGDDSLRDRPLIVRADFTPFDLITHDTYTGTAKLELRRPPVVLVHGLWSCPGTWSYSLQDDPRFDVYTIDYETSHADYFADNIGRMRARVAEALAEARSNCLAVTQVDWIGHSMGGVLGRIYASNRKRNYLRDDNYNAGDLHKLVTVGTPHCGSPVSYLLVNPDSTLTLFGELFASIWPGCVDCGAIRDLRPDSVENQLLLETSVPAHAMVGKGGSDLIESGMESLLPSWLGVLRDARRMALEDIFSSLQHDGVVGRKSQQAGFGDSSPNVSVYGFTGLDFGVHVTETSDSHFGDRATELILASVNGPFASGFERAPIPECDSLAPIGGPNVTLRDGGDAGLTITAPIDGTALSPGQAVTVAAVPSGGFTPVAVLLTCGAQTEFLDSPPYAADFVVPADSVGSLVVRAFGRDGGNELAKANPISVSIAVSANLLDLVVRPDPVRLYGYIGPERLTVRGLYSDAVERNLSGSAIGAVYTSADPNIATVDATGVLTPRRVGATTVEVSSGSVSRVVDVLVISAIGDVDADGLFTVSDALELLACLEAPRQPGQVPQASLPCRDVFDANRDDVVDLLDFAAVAPLIRN